MKRTRQESRRQQCTGRLKSITPKLFWQECTWCENSFKKEPMWSYKLENTHLFSGVRICMECAPDSAIIIEHVVQGSNIFHSPVRRS